MCGINGFTWQDKKLLERMNARIEHRGPDDGGTYTAAGISLGSRRLAVLDLSSAGHQPMRHEHLTITYNGELYNFKEIRRELEAAGYAFRSGGDTEVVLYAYHRWGADCLQKFNGIFALAIWDSQRRELFLARDQLGVKPLYYARDDAGFIFSSEIKGILEHVRAPEVDTSSLNFLLRVLYVPEPATMFRGVRKLRAGHCAYVRDGHFVEQPYWSIDARRPPARRSVADWESRLRQRIAQAVEQQLVSDRPLGVFLSGGWDSTTILGVMRELGVTDIQTFSSGFDVDNPKYNRDFLLARETAAHYGTDHHEVVLGSDEVADLLPEVVRHLAEPNAAPTVLPVYHLARATKAHATVVLGGDGGDELFAGYPRYVHSYYLGRFQRLPGWVRRIFPYRLLGRYLGKRDLARKLNVPAGYERFAMFKVYPAGRIERLMAPGAFEPGLVEGYFAERYGEPAADFERQMMQVDVANWLAVESLWKSDLMTSAHALEYRVPLLDRSLVELAFTIPSRFKIRRFAGKWIFKKAVRRYIPRHLRRAKKMGWLTPGSVWLGRELRPLVERVLDGSYCPELERYIDLGAARELYEEHVAGTRSHLNQLWAVLTFAVWYNQFIARR